VANLVNVTTDLFKRKRQPDGRTQPCFSSRKSRVEVTDDQLLFDILTTDYRDDIILSSKNNAQPHVKETKSNATRDSTARSLFWQTDEM